MSQEEDYQPSLADYIAMVKRHVLLIAVTFISVSAVAITAAVLWPPV